MKRLMFVAISILFVFIACKKTDPTIVPDPKESVLEYMPLKVGNYWVYETYSCDSGEVNCAPVSIDTSWITKDTLINSESYFKIEGGYPIFYNLLFLRDSGDYLVDHHGKVLFTHTDSLQIFNEQSVTNLEGDTVFYWYDKLAAQNEQVTVGAGSFNCMDMRTSFFREVDDFQIEHQGHNYYARNVGLVKQSAFFAVSLHVYKKELIGYHLE